MSHCVKFKSNLGNDQVENEESKPHEGDDSLTVGEGQVDVGAEPHLAVHPGDDHDITKEPEHNNPDMSTDALWQRQGMTKLNR